MYSDWQKVQEHNQKNKNKKSFDIKELAVTESYFKASYI